MGDYRWGSEMGKRRIRTTKAMGEVKCGGVGLEDGKKEQKEGLEDEEVGGSLSVSVCQDVGCVYRLSATICNSNG